jgi:hypothetical protein
MASTKEEPRELKGGHPMKATSTSCNSWQYGRNIINGVLVAVFTMAIGAAQAHATDNKIYPGNMCVRWQGPTPAFELGSIKNTGTTILHLDCPVIRDRINNGIRSGWVDVVDNNLSSDFLNNPNMQVCATLFRVSRVGSTTFTTLGTGPVCSRSGGLTSQRLSLGGLSHSPHAHYFYRISIPPVPSSGGGPSSVISYHVEENE